MTLEFLCWSLCDGDSGSCWSCCFRSCCSWGRRLRSCCPKGSQLRSRCLRVMRWGLCQSRLQWDACRLCGIACVIVRRCYAWRGAGQNGGPDGRRHVFLVFELFLVVHAVLSWTALGRSSLISLLGLALIWRQCWSQGRRDCNRTNRFCQHGTRIAGRWICCIRTVLIRL